MQPNPPAPDPFHWAADLSAILTCALAVAAYVQFGLRSLRQRLRLEKALKDIYNGPRPNGDTGKRTLLHFVAELGMSEAEVLDAAFRSKKVKRVKVADPKTKKTVQIMLQYKPLKSEASLAIEEAA